MPADLIRLFYEDVYWRNERLFINSESVRENERLVESLFNPGTERNFGISLNAFCRAESKIGCYIFVPEDETDAEYHFLDGPHPKYSISTNLRAATLVENVFLRKLFRFPAASETSRIRKDYLPSKKLAVSTLFVNY